MEVFAVIVVVLIFIAIAKAKKEAEKPKVKGLIIEAPHQGGCLHLILVALTFVAAAGALLARMM